MKKSIKSFKAISEKKKTTVKGGYNWTYHPLGIGGGCNRFCNGDDEDK